MDRCQTEVMDRPSTAAMELELPAQPRNGMVARMTVSFLPQPVMEAESTTVLTVSVELKQLVVYLIRFLQQELPMTLILIIKISAVLQLLLTWLLCIPILTALLFRKLPDLHGVRWSSRDRGIL